MPGFGTSEWVELTRGALSNWPESIPSQYRHQLVRLECKECGYKIEPGDFRRYDETRKDHPMPYGNFASVSHARKLMREHIREEHSFGGDTCRARKM